MIRRNKRSRSIPVIHRPSPNFNARKADLDMIVLHYTGMSSLREVLDKLTDEKSELSAHFVVDIDGRIFQLVGQDKRAWHAGVSNWQGKRDINSRSIGIEIMNNGQERFTKEQMISVIAICRAMMDKYDIPPHHVVGHSDVAPGRKIDPGPLFPWAHLARYDVGLAPDVRLRDYFTTSGKHGDVNFIRSMLTRLGYGSDFSPNATPPLRDMVAAFQSRFEQEVYSSTPDKVGIPTRRTAALLQACVREHDRLEAAYRKMLHDRAYPNKPDVPKYNGPKK